MLKDGDKTPSSKVIGKRFADMKGSHKTGNAETGEESANKPSKLKCVKIERID